RVEVRLRHDDGFARLFVRDDGDGFAVGELDGRRSGGHRGLALLQVLAADDHPLALAGLRALLGSLEGIALVGAAASGDEAVRLAAEREPDVVLMDLEMPGTDGVRATR